MDPFDRLLRIENGYMVWGNMWGEESPYRQSVAAYLGQQATYAEQQERACWERAAAPDSLTGEEPTLGQIFARLEQR